MDKECTGSDLKESYSSIRQKADTHEKMERIPSSKLQTFDE